MGSIAVVCSIGVVGGVDMGTPMGEGRTGHRCMI